MGSRDEVVVGVGRGDAEARFLVDLGKGFEPVKRVPAAGFPHGIPVVVVKQGEEVKSLLSLVPDRPDRIEQVVALSSVASFVAYVKRFKDARTVVFASTLKAPYTFTAVMDYHGTGAKPEWAKHRAVLTLTTTPEWERWLGANGRLMGQEAFASFIEENVVEVKDPEPATMMELALTLEMSQSAEYRGKTNLQNGDVQLHVGQNTEMKAGKAGEIVIPKEMTLRIAPFRGLETIDLQARFRVRLDPPRVGLGFEIIRVEAAIDKMLAAANDKIHLEAEVPVFQGAVG